MMSRQKCGRGCSYSEVARLLLAACQSFANPVCGGLIATDATFCHAHLLFLEFDRHDGGGLERDRVGVSVVCRTGAFKD